MAQLDTEYRKARKVHTFTGNEFGAGSQSQTTAERAIEEARTAVEWDKLDGCEQYEGDDYDEDGSVRLLSVTDDNWEYGLDFYCCDQPSAEGETLCRHKVTQRERIERDGMYGVVPQYRTSLSDEWQDADGGVFGFIGNDWASEGWAFRLVAIDAYRQHEGC